MSLLLAAFLAAAGASPARLLSLRVETVGTRPAVRILVAGQLQRVEVKREGDAVLVRLGAEAPPTMAPPPPMAPIGGIFLEREPEGLLLRIAVAPEVPYEVRREASVLTVLFGEAPAAETQGRRPGTAELYQRIFPAAPLDAGVLDTMAAAAPAPENRPSEEDENKNEGLTVGAFTIRPTLATSYVEGDAALSSTAAPIHDRYFQVQPRISGEAPFLLGDLKVDYEARIRRGSSFDLLDSTTHLANLSVEMPLGVRVLLRASDHVARGTLETTEVDPGREYFFGLARFTRNQADVSARMEAGVRSSFILGASHDLVKFDGASSFFGYERQGVRAGLGFDVSPALRAELAYNYERVPAPLDRPEAGLRGHLVQLSLLGEILPLLKGSLAVGYRDEEHAALPGVAGRFRGLTAAASLTKELSRSASVSLTGNRSSHLSAFERNAFYVASAVQVEIKAPLPYSLSLRAGVGYHRNRYTVVASGLAEPRADNILGWAVGLGRPLSRWAYLRADYRKERRDSNVGGLSNTTEALVVQLGVGFFGVPGQR